MNRFVRGEEENYVKRFWTARRDSSFTGLLRDAILETGNESFFISLLREKLEKIT